MLMPAGSEFRNNYMAEVTVSLPWLNRRKHDSEIREAERRVQRSCGRRKLRKKCSLPGDTASADPGACR